MEDDAYIVECGRRLQAARIALGHPKRPSLVKLTFDIRNNGDLRREADNLRKWETGGAMPPPWYVNKLKRLFGIDPNWIYSSDASRMPPDLAARVVEILESGLEQVE